MKSTTVGVATATLPKLLGVDSSQCLSILIYHRVTQTTDLMLPGVPCVRDFDWQMQLISQHFSPLSLSEAVDRLREGSLPRRAICVTFDDGYADNLTLASPILRKWSVPATVFISTDYLDGGLMWNDQVIESIRQCAEPQVDIEELGLFNLQLSSNAQRLRSCEKILQTIKHLPQSKRQWHADQLVDRLNIQVSQNLMLSSTQVVELAAAGIDIGGHTVTHPILSAIDDEQAKSEIESGKAKLEELIGKSLEFFAYPNGVPERDFLPAHVKMVEEAGFRGAVTTQWGVASQSTDPFLIPRFTPWDKSYLGFATRLLLNMRNQV